VDVLVEQSQRHFEERFAQTLSRLSRKTQWQRLSRCKFSQYLQLLLENIALAIYCMFPSGTVSLSQVVRLISWRAKKREENRH
jgi:hypothetical protein